MPGETTNDTGSTTNRSWVANGIIGVAILLAAAAITTLVTTPQEQSEKSDERLEQQIEALRTELAELKRSEIEQLRNDFVQHKAEIAARLSVAEAQIVTASADRYLGTVAASDWAAQAGFNGYIEKQVDKLTEYDQRLWDYLLTERRAEDIRRTQVPD